MLNTQSKKREPSPNQSGGEPPQSYLVCKGHCSLPSLIGSLRYLSAALCKL